jgi:hypothetical protein
MMSCTASVAWSRLVSSLCYTEHGQCCGAVLSGRITTVTMSRSGQLGLRCTVEPKCSGLSACLAGASVTCDRALDTCENVDGGPPRGAGAGDPAASTINVKTSTAGPRDVPELEVQERPPST